MVVMEKRKIKRKRLINFLAVHDKNTYQPIGRMVNGSIAGIMISFDEPVKENTVFKFKLSLPKAIDNKNSVTIEVKSVWCHIDKETDFYNAGFQLINVSLANKNIIESMLRDHAYYY